MALRRAIGPAAIAVALFAAWQSGLFEALGFDNLVANRERLTGLVARNLPLAVASYMALYAALAAIGFPGASLLTMAAGFLFGGLIAGTATLFAATCGACLLFLLARGAAGDFLTRRAGGFAAKMAEGFNRDAFSYLLSLRLMPVFPFWAINIAPALLGMRLLPFAAATFIGIIPGTFAYSFIGAGLDSAIAAQEGANPGCSARHECAIDPVSLATPEIVWGLFALAAISLLPVLVRVVRRN